MVIFFFFLSEYNGYVMKWWFILCILTLLLLCSMIQFQLYTIKWSAAVGICAIIPTIHRTNPSIFFKYGGLCHDCCFQGGDECAIVLRTRTLLFLQFSQIHDVEIEDGWRMKIDLIWFLFSFFHFVFSVYLRA